MRMVVSAVQIETSFRHGLRLQSPFDVVEARLQEWEQPCKRCSAVELPIRRVHVWLFPDLRRHVEASQSMSARLIPGRPRRRQLRVAEETGSLQTVRHREIKQHGYLPLDHTVARWGADGCVPAADATAVQHLHEIRPDELGAVIRANAHHDDGTPAALSSARNLVKAAGTSDFRFRKITIPSANSRRRSSSRIPARWQ